MIAKELKNKEQAERKLVQKIDPVDEMKLITDGDALRDRAILDSAFPQSTNVIIMNVNAENSRTDTLKQKYEGEIYTLNQIKDLCLKYRLRFLQSRLYKGKVPIDVIHKINEKLKINSLAHLQGMSGTALGRELYVIAPAKMFNLKDAGKTKIEAIKEAKRLAALDPALFLKIDDNRFLYITEWGNSFSFLRQIPAFFVKTKQRINWLFFFIWVASVFLLWKTGAFLWTKFSSDDLLPTILFGLYVVLSLTWAACSLCDDINTFPFLKRYKSRNGWFDSDKLLASEHNWDLDSKA